MTSLDCDKKNILMIGLFQWQIHRHCSVLCSVILIFSQNFKTIILKHNAMISSCNAMCNIMIGFFNCSMRYQRKYKKVSVCNPIFWIQEYRINSQQLLTASRWKVFPLEGLSLLRSRACLICLILLIALVIRCVALMPSFILHGGGAGLFILPTV